MIIMIILLLILILILYFFTLITKTNTSNYYDALTLFPELISLITNDTIIKNEIKLIDKKEWTDWKEYNLVNNGGDWKIIPLFINNKWNTKYETIFPILFKTLKNIISFDNIKQIAISKLSPNTKLNSHCGWSSYSNYHLRCHYPIILPLIDNVSYISVENDIKFHKYNNFILFDDSKEHFAHNCSTTQDRIVLIMDFIRPSKIPLGTSTVEDTTEYLEFMKDWN